MNNNLGEKMIKEKKEIVDALNWSCFSGEKVSKEISEKDIYITKGWLFVNMSATKSPQGYSGIDVYKYPLNDYCESYTSLWNLYNKPFKNYVNNEVDFTGEYPKEKSSPTIVMVESKITKGRA